MLITFIRTILLYLMILLTFRILGKRQIGELQPADLVLTILLSEILAIPIEDGQLPLIQTAIPVLTLIGLEILLSVLSTKSIRFRTLMQGNPILLIANGKLDQKALKSLRFTIDDLLEALRKKDVFDLSAVQYAIVETDGTLSVLLKAEAQTPTCADCRIQTHEATLPTLVISDGRFIKKALPTCGQDKKNILNWLQAHRKTIENVYVLTADENGQFYCVDKENSQ